MKHPEYEKFGFGWVDEMYPENKEEEKNMKSECERRNCGYFWKEENEAYPHCHYNDPMFPAPCEEDDNDYDEDWDDDFDEEEEYADDLEMGFDPYEGGYTWDC